jgi:hypothetical protein
MEWAQVRALAADGVSQREIAARLGINRRTVRRLVEAADPPRYRRQSTRSMLDPLEPVVRRLLEEWPEINAPRVTEILRDSGYEGSVDLVKKRLARMRPSKVRPAQKMSRLHCRWALFRGRRQRRRRPRCRGRRCAPRDSPSASSRNCRRGCRRPLRQWRRCPPAGRVCDDAGSIGVRCDGDAIDAGLADQVAAEHRAGHRASGSWTPSSRSRRSTA